MRLSYTNAAFILTTLASLLPMVFTAGIPPATSLDIQARGDKIITKTKTVAKTTKTVVKTTTKTISKVTVTKTATKTLSKTTTKTSTKPLPKATITKTTTVTKPASTVIRTTTIPGPIRTETTTQTSTQSVTLPASTVTEIVTVSAEPKHNVPNGDFEQVSDTGGWCNGAPRSPCTIVSNSSDGSFSGLFGPNMLEFGLSESDTFGDLRVPVPVASTRNPAGRDWTLTAWYRPRPGNPNSCWPILGWLSGTGLGFGRQPQLNGQDAWQPFRATLPQSAGGRSENWYVYVTAGCSPPGVLYIDGIIVD